MMRLKGFTATAVAAAVVGVLAMPAKPAFAAGDYTVTSGGATTAVTATNAGYLRFEDTYLAPFGTPGNPRTTCTSLSMPGLVKPGDHTFTASPPVADAAVEFAPAAGGLSGCSNAAAGQVTATSSGVWRLGLASKTVTGGVANLSDIHLHFYYPWGNAYCEFDVTGAVRGIYDETTGEFVLDPSYPGLVLSDVRQVAGICEVIGFYEDDPAAISGTIDLSPAPTIS